MPILAIQSYQPTKSTQRRNLGLRFLDTVQRLTNPHDYTRQVIEDLRDTLSHLQSKGSTLVSLHAKNLAYTPPRYPENFIPPHIYVISIPEDLARRNKCLPLKMSVFIDAQYTHEDHPIRLSKKETCIAFPGFTAVVPRYDKIFLTTKNETGENISFKIEATGFLARIHQQKIDAQNGMEYLFHLQFTREELDTIQKWIARNKPTQQPLEGWVDLGPNPVVVFNKLECTSHKPDFDALEAWINDTLPDQNFQHANPPAPSHSALDLAAEIPPSPTGPS